MCNFAPFWYLSTSKLLIWIKMRVVRKFVEQGYADRIQQFNDSVCSLNLARDRVATWNEQGAATVLMAGVFDLPTPSHRLSLAEGRPIAAAISLGLDYSLLADSP